MSVAKGSTLAQFKIVAKLGEGGMGVVWRAKDTELGREVAIKVLPPDMAADRERLDRFRREAQSVAQLNHPNIVTLHAVAEDQGVHFLVLELIEGESLDEILLPAGLGRNRIFELAIPIAEALAAAHAKGVTHRDLKPANVMLTHDGLVKILDFGLAKLAEKPTGEQTTELLTKEGTLLGTVPYMSPEQVQGREADHRSDIFSFGVLLYEMATGRRPFGGEDPASVISSILRDEPLPVTELKSGLPNHLGRIVRRCLEKDPERRFQSAKELRIELEDLRQEVASSASGSEVRDWRPAPGAAIPYRPRWVVAGKLGEGAFGEVWLAEHEKTRDRRVFKFCFEAARLEALEREITFIRLLKEELGQRDDIAGILDWNLDIAPFFIESEYTEGGHLGQWVEEHGGLQEVPFEIRLEIVAQVATALAAAHSVGVLHKDLRPANVLIKPDPQGRPRVRLTDFGVSAVAERRRPIASGIASGAVPSFGSQPSADSEDGGSRLYVAPEVAHGGARTLQADVYSLGVLLYQMVVGDFSRPLAEGWDSDVDDELLREDIAWAVDPSPEGRLKNALRIAERLRALDTRREKLQEIEHSPKSEGHALHQWPTTRILLAGALLGAVLALIARSLVGPEPPGGSAERANRLSVVFPPELSVEEVEMSPDGGTLAMVARPRAPSSPDEDLVALYLRPLDSYRTRQVPGSEALRMATFSSDGQWLAFVAPDDPQGTKRYLWKAPVDGSAPPLRVRDWNQDCAGVHWLPDGDLVVGASTPEIVRIPTDGRSPESRRPVVAEDFEFRHLHLLSSHRTRLPDGRHLLTGVESWSDEGYVQNIVVVDVETGESRVVLENGGQPRWSENGYLLFSRGTTLLAVPFDADRLTVTGGPVALVDDLRIDSPWDHGAFDLGADGSLAYTPGGSVGDQRRLVWMDRDFEEVKLWSEDRLAIEQGPFVSPDGRRFAVVIAGSDGVFDIWLSEPDKALLRKWQEEPNRDCGSIVWSPGGDELVYSCMDESESLLYIRPAAADGTPTLLLKEQDSSANYFATTFADGGETLLVSHQHDGGSDIVALAPRKVDPNSGPPRVVLEEASDAVLSPDGRWIAYRSERSGRVEAYVRRWKGYGELGPEHRVSTDGATGAIDWYAIGGDEPLEIWFVHERRLFSVTMRTEPELEFSRPALVKGNLMPRYRSFDIFPDGSVLACLAGEEEQPARFVHLVRGWAREMHQRLKRARVPGG